MGPLGVRHAASEPGRRAPGDRDIERAHPALAGLERAWGALSVDLSSLRVRHGRVDPQLVLAGREVQAAIREITHHHAGSATPQVMADRTDLAAATDHLNRSLATAVDLAHVIRDALNDPDLTVSARAAHTMAAHSLTPSINAAFVDVGSLHHDRDIPLPPALRSSLGKRAEQIITAAVTADSAAVGLRRLRTPQQQVADSDGRANEDRTPPTSTPPSQLGLRTVNTSL